MSRCTGHCCRAFPLSCTLEELRAPDTKLIDAAFVADMLIPLGKRPGPSGELREVYTCRHLSAGGDCTVYERRPRVCWEYPYSRECNVEGCTRDPEACHDICAPDNFST